jgi:demethylmenaquinone methyltransferase / 2-methoxy-6-polyprenyl-1,4-benzoquinol methylase
MASDRASSEPERSPARQPDRQPESLAPHPPLARYYGDEGERRRLVDGWFDEAAPTYDWIGQAASLGSGHRYRRQALRRAGLERGMRALDVGCGTGVLAAYAREIVGPAGLAVALDPSLGMLRETGRRGVLRRVRALGEALPFASGRFDFLSMGYALRHVADLKAAFAEYRRVLKPGGKVLLLEITRPEGRLAFRTAKLFLGGLVPRLARLKGGRGPERLMEYYWDTIEHCVPPATILAALEEAGFAGVARRVQQGLLSEYSGVA